MFHSADLVTCRAGDVARERMAKVVNEMGLASAKVR